MPPYKWIGQLESKIESTGAVFKPKSRSPTNSAEKYRKRAGQLSKGEEIRPLFKTSILFLTLLLFGYQAFSISKEEVLPSLEEFRSLDPVGRAEVIKSIYRFLQAESRFLEKSNSYGDLRDSENFDFFKNLTLIETAFAQDQCPEIPPQDLDKLNPADKLLIEKGTDCLFAGNPTCITYVPSFQRALCTAKQEHRCRTENGLPGIKCNPLLFQKRDGSPICVARSNSSTDDCINFAEALKPNEIGARLGIDNSGKYDSLRSQINYVCHEDRIKAFNIENCKNLKSRIGEILANLDRVRKNETLFCSIKVKSVFTGEDHSFKMTYNSATKKFILSSPKGETIEGDRTLDFAMKNLASGENINFMSKRNNRPIGIPSSIRIPIKSINGEKGGCNPTLNFERPFAPKEFEGRKICEMNLELPAKSTLKSRFKNRPRFLLEYLCQNGGEWYYKDLDGTNSTKLDLIKLEASVKPGWSSYKIRDQSAFYLSTKNYCKGNQHPETKKDTDLICAFSFTEGATNSSNSGQSLRSVQLPGQGE